MTFSTPSLGASLSSVNTTGQITVFGVNNSITSEISNTPQNRQDALGGTATAAGGNIELNNTIDNGWVNTNLSTLTATFSDNRSIAFSSLTQSDWFANGFASTWYTAARSVYSTQFTDLAATLTNMAAQQVYQTAYNQVYSSTSNPVTATAAANLAKTQFFSHQYFGCFQRYPNGERPRNSQRLPAFERS